jgi:hypothetical protein
MIKVGFATVVNVGNDSMSMRGEVLFRLDPTRSFVEKSNILLPSIGMRHDFI